MIAEIGFTLLVTKIDKTVGTMVKIRKEQSLKLS